MLFIGHYSVNVISVTIHDIKFNSQNIVQCSGSLDHFWSPVVPWFATEDAGQIVNSFYSQLTVVTTITYSTLTCVHNLQALHTKLLSLPSVVFTGWLLSYQLLSQIITHCCTRKVFNSHCELTVMSSYNNRRELTLRIHFLKTPLENWLKTANHFTYIARNSGRKSEPVDTVVSGHVMSCCLAAVHKEYLLRRHCVYNGIALVTSVVPCNSAWPGLQPPAVRNSTE
jgi:hypothetical protein